jgi:hypothetical protein
VLAGTGLTKRVRLVSQFAMRQPEVGARRTIARLSDGRPVVRTATAAVRRAVRRTNLEEEST